MFHTTMLLFIQESLFHLPYHGLVRGAYPNHVQGKREDHDRYQTTSIVIYFSCIRWVLRPASSGKEI